MLELGEITSVRIIIRSWLCCKRWWLSVFYAKYFFSYWLHWQNQFSEISTMISRSTWFFILLRIGGKKKKGMGETYICGSISKLNWISELHCCVHHKFASRVTQMLAVVETAFSLLLNWYVLLYPAFAQRMTNAGLKQQHSIPPWSPTSPSVGFRDSQSSGELAGSGPPRIRHSSYYANSR